MSARIEQDTDRAAWYAESRKLAAFLYRQSKANEARPWTLSGMEAHEAWLTEAAQHGDDVLVANLRRVHLPSFVAHWNWAALESLNSEARS